MNAKNQNGWPAVVRAASNGRTEVVEALLRLGCDPDAPDLGGWTALMAAAYHGHSGVVGALLQHGADLDAREHRGESALMCAAATGQADTARLLISAKADASLRASRGRWGGKTALELTALKPAAARSLWGATRGPAGHERKLEAGRAQVAALLRSDSNG